MTWQSESSAIKAHFDTEWTAAQASLLWNTLLWGGKQAVKVAYPNIDDNTIGKPPLPWVRLSVLTGDSVQAAVGGGGGNRLWRTVGAVVVQVFVPVGSGERIARQYADVIGGIFRGKRVGDLLFRAPSLIVIGAQPSGAWFQLNVNCPYQRDNLQ